MVVEKIYGMFLCPGNTVVQFTQNPSINGLNTPKQKLVVEIFY
jgi:hypothetical protein